jgi:inositol oxygenase
MSDTSAFAPHERTPLNSLEQWEEFVLLRYPHQGQPADPQKDKDAYRNYDNPARDTVREFYRLNHTYQTYEFVLDKEKEFLNFDRNCMTPWEALEYLNTLVDESDPDIDLSQLEHLLQTSEAIRADGHPDWFVLTGLLHDLGKVLCLFGEPQWAVVGDTFPVGCRFSSKIVYHEFFAHNPDSRVLEFQTDCGK